MLGGAGFEEEAAIFLCLALSLERGKGRLPLLVLGFLVLVPKLADALGLMGETHDFQQQGFHFLRLGLPIRALGGFAA